MKFYLSGHINIKASDKAGVPIASQSVEFSGNQEELNQKLQLVVFRLCDMVLQDKKGERVIP